MTAGAGTHHDQSIDPGGCSLARMLDADDIMEHQAAIGMHTLDQDLARLVNKGTITFEDALVKVQVREEFEKLCGARSSF